jgi:hypothetical protein
MPQKTVDTLSHSHNYTSCLPLLFITLSFLYTEAKKHLCFTSRSNPYIYECNVTPMVYGQSFFNGIVLQQWKNKEPIRFYVLLMTFMFQQQYIKYDIVTPEWSGHSIHLGPQHNIPLHLGLTLHPHSHLHPTINYCSCRSIGIIIHLPLSWWSIKSLYLIFEDAVIDSPHSERPRLWLLHTWWYSMPHAFAWVYMSTIWAVLFTPKR